MSNVDGISPEGDREHIISLYGHVTGLQRNIEVLSADVEHLHRDVEKLGGRIDRIYWGVITGVGAAVLLLLESTIEMMMGVS
jgi:chorismate synthase